MLAVSSVLEILVPLDVTSSSLVCQAPSEAFLMAPYFFARKVSEGCPGVLLPETLMTVTWLLC